MLFERFEDEGLAHYSYAVACPDAGKVAIVDPKRDVDTYIAFAAQQELEISHVLETHIHADFASGARELAERTGATLYVSGHDEGEDYSIQFPHSDLHDGDAFEIGSVRIQALHTPGHTPEHLSYLVYDSTRTSDVPLLMLSGDFLFVGSLGRPDLLGEEDKRELAESLFDSVHTKLADLPDGLEVHPAHGAGSMCGSGMGGRPMSTLGYERAANPYLDKSLSKDEFVSKILADVPPLPDYYSRMKRVNSEGPKLLNELPGQEAILTAAFKERVDDGKHVVIDLREQLAFGGGHIPGAFGIGAGQNLSTWASWVVPYDTPILLVAHDAEEIEEATRALIRVGLDEVEGYLDGGIAAWRTAGYRLETIAQQTPADLYDRLQHGESIHLLDVRTEDEWNSGHVEGATHLMAGKLLDNLDQVPTANGAIAVMCGSGYRSTVAASVLQRNGFDNLINVTGGMTAWKKADLPLTQD